VLGEDRREAAVDLLERVVPGGLVELTVGAADQRGLEPVRVFVQRLEAVRLRAQKAAAEHVVLVAADLHDLAVHRLDGQPASRLAERAGAEVRLGYCCDPGSLTIGERPAPVAASAAT